MPSAVCLDTAHSTTKLNISKKNKGQHRTLYNEPPLLVRSGKKTRIGEGGLRLKGYFKQSLPHKPLLTVVTVVYNAQELLEKTILSITNQTYENIEYIVVDGGSDDGTVDIIRKYEHTVDYWISEEDNGIYDAMNKAIDVATGDWVIFMNAGDSFFDTSVVQRVFDKLSSLDNRANVLYGGADVYTERGEFVTRLSPLNFTKRNLNMFATRTVCHQSIFVSREIIPKYSSEFKLKAELYWYYGIIKKIDYGHSLRLNFPICNYSLGGTGDVHFKRNFVERIKVMRKHNHIIAFIFWLPFIIVPLVFRLKRKISGK